jgi:hypothetical protein
MSTKLPLSGKFSCTFTLIHSLSWMDGFIEQRTKGIILLQHNISCITGQS